MVDISKEDSGGKEDSGEDDDSAERSRGTSSRRPQSHPQRRRSLSALPPSNERELLLNQSKAFRDYENLFVALDAMEQWKALADKAPKYEISKKVLVEFPLTSSLL